MQILANALPGFRDLRGPVIAGYAWLLFAWLIVAPDLHRRPHGQFGAAIYDLGHEVGPITIGVAVSVAAYLIGAASRELVEMVGRAYVRSRSVVVTRALSDSIDWGDEVGVGVEINGWSLDRPDPENPASMLFAAQPTRSARRRALALLAQIDEVTDDANRKIRADFEKSAERTAWLGPEDAAKLARRAERAINVRRERALRDLDRELDVPAMLLLADQPEVFAEVDRLRAEAELRFAVVPPLTALAVLLATGDPVWLASIVGGAVLLVQGIRQRQDGRAIVLEAMRLGRIESRSLTAFAKWVESETVDGLFDDAIERDPELRKQRDAFKRRARTAPGGR